MMENSPGPPPKSLEKHIRQIFILCQKADELVEEDDPQALVHPSIHSLRVKVIKLCKTVCSDPEWGPRILDKVWKSCYYSVICRIRRAALSVEQKNWTEMLLGTFVKELFLFAKEFPHLCALICLYIGDLRRYTWLISGCEKYRTLALLCYRKSARLDEGSGIALNQLGLLIQEASPTRALLYFLLANNAPMPFNGAYSNIVRLLKQQKEQQQEQKREEDPTIAIVEHCFTCFRQLDFQELSAEWSEYIISQLENRHASHAALSINIIILAAIALAEKGKGLELRSLSDLFLRISEPAIGNLEEWSAAAAETTNLRRRRASSSSLRESGEEAEVEEEEEEEEKKKRGHVRSASMDADVVSEDDEEEEEEAQEATQQSLLSKQNQETRHRIQTLLVALLQAATSLAPHLYNDSVPSAFYCQYEEYCQRLIQFLNLLELCLDGKSESLWHLGGSTPWVLMPRFLQAFVHSSHTPVVFEDFFRFAPKNSTKESYMKNMAKLRLAHHAEEEHLRASLPLYVVPEEEILLQRLDIIKTILKKNDLIVVVDEGTVRSMDRIKKDKPEARKALRWINTHISESSGGRLRMRPALAPMKCAEELAAQAPTTSTVIATVLTLRKVEPESTIKPIMIENADSFCARYDKVRKDHTTLCG